VIPPGHIELERLTYVAPLGVRFFDLAVRRHVRELLVSAAPVAAPGRRITLFANPSGVFVLRGAPGLREFEGGAGDATFWAGLPAPTPYLVEVRDPRGELLACSFVAAVPTHGVFRWACGPSDSPPRSGSADVPLYSAPARTPPEGAAVLRADLREPAGGPDLAAPGRPAASAVVEVLHDGSVIGRGIADARGSVCVIFPYPPPVDLVPDSPLVTGVRLAQQQWSLGVRIAYRPEPQPPALLDLCLALTQLEHTPAQAWQVWSGPAGTGRLGEAVLRYGEELVLRSRSPSDGRPLSHLFVTPAA
jgi:hypothetical protein